MRPHLHVAYGMVLQSEHPLPGLEPAPAGATGGVEIRLGERPHWADEPVTRVLHEARDPGLAMPVVIAGRVGDHGLRLHYGEGIRFHVASTLDRVWADWDPPLEVADAMTFLMGPVLGYLLRARGVLALHASAVVVRGVLVGFVGPAGSGKSTLAAALAARGHAVLSDDVLALRESAGGWIAAPGLDQVRLWDESARLLFGAAHGLPPLSAAWEKRGLTLRERGLRFSETPEPLGGIVLLDGDPGPIPSPALEPAVGQDALLSIIGNTYVTYLLDERARANELSAIARLVAGVRIIRLIRPAGGGEPTEAAAAIERWVDDRVEGVTA